MRPDLRESDFKRELCRKYAINKPAVREIWGIIKTCLISWNTLPAFVRKSRIYGT
jgi:hypothetical protein